MGVLLLVQGDAGRYRLAPWRNEDVELDVTRALSEAEELALARERVRLPIDFSVKYNWNGTIKELQCVPPRWTENRLVARELLLILDEKLEAEIIGKKLKYDDTFGLELIKEDEGTI